MAYESSRAWAWTGAAAVTYTNSRAHGMGIWGSSFHTFSLSVTAPSQPACEWDSPMLRWFFLRLAGDILESTNGLAIGRGAGKNVKLAKNKSHVRGRVEAGSPCRKGRISLIIPGLLGSHLIGFYFASLDRSDFLSPLLHCSLLPPSFFFITC